MLCFGMNRPASRRVAEAQPGQLRQTKLTAWRPGCRGAGLGRPSATYAVNNAALFADDPSTQGRRLSCDVAESSYDQWVSAWRRTTDVNLLGTANVTYQVAHHMIEVQPADGCPRGRIITVGSRGAYRGEPDVPAYGASKAAAQSMTQSLAVALAPRGISCVGIAPEGSSPPT
jgi:NAD(P)-dependent dehydrogenase (short-subunit alcohol dehydrogenase family)